MSSRCQLWTKGVATSALVAIVFGGCAASRPDLDRASRQLRAGKTDVACAALQQLVDRPAGGSAQRLDQLRLWVECRVRQGRAAQAERWLAGKPATDAGALYARALLVVARDPARLEVALRLLDQAARLWPEQGELPYRAGWLLLADDQAARALHHLRRAYRLHPTAACSVAIAHAELDLGRTDQALIAVRRVLAEHPRALDVARGRALIARVVKRSRDMPPAVASVYRAALAERRDPQRALDMLEPLLAKYPRMAPLQAASGLLQLALGQTAAAIVGLRRAIELDRYDAISAFYLASVYRSLGRRDEAIVLLQRAAKLNPFDVPTLNALEELLTIAGQRSEVARVQAQLTTLRELTQRPEVDDQPR